MRLQKYPSRELIKKPIWYGDHDTSPWEVQGDFNSDKVVIVIAVQSQPLIIRLFMDRSIYSTGQLPKYQESIVALVSILVSTHQFLYEFRHIDCIVRFVWYMIKIL